MSDVPPPAPAEGQVAQTSPPADRQVVARSENNQLTGTVNDEEPIMCPPSSSRQAGVVYGLLGLQYRDDRKPVYSAVKKVWDGWAFRAGKLTWSEVPEELRLALEEELRKELAQLFTEPEHSETASKIRRCQEWLPRFLLNEKHRLRTRGRRK